MTTLSRSRLLALVLLAVLALAAIPFSTPTEASHSWSNYHWGRTSNPFTIKLGDNVTSNWDSYLSTASADWNKSTVLDTVVVAGQSNKRCAATAGRVEVCNNTYGNNGWLGLAQVWLSGGHISQGTAKMNDTYFNQAAYNTPAERAHVMCQEVGHTFGLGHQDESGASLGTCMDYADDSTNSQHPDSHDYSQLQSIYSHLDSSSTVGLLAGVGKGESEVAALPAEIAQAEMDTVAQWGALVGRSKNGRAELYERDFGNGYKVVTAVYWAEPRGHVGDDH
jgi:hypothetical protein